MLPNPQPKYFYSIVSNDQMSSCLYSYLTSEDLLNFSQCDKTCSKAVLSSNQIIHKQINSGNKTLGDIIFKKEHFFDYVNQSITEQMWKITDKLYIDFYHTNQKILQIYFFLTLIIGLDLFTLILACNFYYLDDFDEVNQAWIFFSPFFIEWLLSLITLIVYKVRLSLIKKRVKEVIQQNKEKIIAATDKNLKAMYNKLKLRTKYCKHNVFENWLHGIIMFFIPFILRITIFHESTYEIIFLIASSLFYIAMFISELVKFFRLKCKAPKNKFDYYKKKYPMNAKILLIEQTLQKNQSLLSETGISISFFLCKLAFGILFVIYFTQIGGKIDDPNKNVLWVTLFTPVYILYIPMLGYVILHFYSFASLFKKDLWKVIVTMIPCIFAFIANSIIIPLKMDKIIGLNAFWIPGIFSIGTIFLGGHIYVISKKIDD